MTYSEDLRQKVRDYVNSGHTQVEASAVFAICTKSISRWLSDHRPAQKPGRKGPDKLNETKLLQHVKDYPDKLLRERAEEFGMSINGIWVALKRLGVKKNAEISGTGP